MAQGLIKESKLGQSKGKKPTGVTKKGKRTIAPKRASLVKNAQLIKKHCAGLTPSTERLLSSKAGHLELLKGGKKNKDMKGLAPKGGTKKFG